jgi:hypothetical protein
VQWKGRDVPSLFAPSCVSTKKNPESAGIHVPAIPVYAHHRRFTLVVVVRHVHVVSNGICAVEGRVKPAPFAASRVSTNLKTKVRAPVYARHRRRRRAPCTCSRQWDMCSGRGGYNPPCLLPVVSAFNNKKQKCGHTCARCPCLRVPVVDVMHRVCVVGGGVCAVGGEGCTLPVFCQSCQQRKKNQKVRAHLCPLSLSMRCHCCCCR